MLATILKSAGGKVVPNYTLYMWGYNASGQLGDGTTTNRSSPVQVGVLSDWAQVAGGVDGGATGATLAIKTNGTLWAWGSNTFGTLGDGTTTDRSSPVQIGALSDWAQVAVGDNQSYAIKTNGTLWAWGNSTAGVGMVSSPTQVGALSDWAQISASNRGYVHSIKTNGTLWAWGDNGSGTFGNGTSTSTSSPVQIGALSNWAQISSGNLFSWAVKTDGTLWAWGNNTSGQLGTGNTTVYSSPVQVGALSNWAQVSCGSNNGYAIKTDGTLWACGQGFYGSNGNSSTGDLSSPTQIGALTDWVSISAESASGAACAFAVRGNGTLWAWGRNTWGQLGDGTTTDRSSPVQIGSGTTWGVVGTARGNFVGALRT